MINPESCETVFSLFYSRFPNTPLLVCYDNACNLLEYCFNREPFFFKDYIFVVDRMHFKNHKNCTAGRTLLIFVFTMTPVCAGHNIDSFFWAEFFNSQVAEQANSSTGKLQTQSSFMTVHHFTIYLRFFAAEFNRHKLQRILQDCRKKGAGRHWKGLHVTLSAIYGNILRTPQYCSGTCQVCVLLNDTFAFR
jgi:hypothetical protein